MGWFNRKSEERQRRLEATEREDEALAKAKAADPNSQRKTEFHNASVRGDLDRASSLLDDYLTEYEVDPGPTEYDRGRPSLLERAAQARRATKLGDLDEAASILAAWEIKPPPTSTTGPERFAQLPNLNTLGMLLIDFFSLPGAESNSQYDLLLDTKLRQVAQWTRLSSPQPRPGGFFDQAYGQFKSKRELSRARS
ncbi:MAG TPA: hypothetical protein VFB52_05740 [Solirubrobacterales bacterium]|nr:hypothetical protein [Solirubrobacterales bacterium]